MRQRDACHSRNSPMGQSVLNLSSMCGREHSIFFLSFSFYSQASGMVAFSRRFGRSDLCVDLVPAPSAGRHVCGSSTFLSRVELYCSSLVFHFRHCWLASTILRANPGRFGYAGRAAVVPRARVFLSIFRLPLCCELS